jgi:hypothetical protein
MKRLIDMADRAWLPDAWIRLGPKPMSSFWVLAGWHTNR